VRTATIPPIRSSSSSAVARRVAVLAIEGPSAVEESVEGESGDDPEY